MLCSETFELLDHLRDPALLLDGEDRVLHVSKALLEELRLPLTAVRNQPLGALCSPGAPPSVTPLERARRTGLPFKGRLELLRADGSAFPFPFESFFLSRPQGEDRGKLVLRTQRIRDPEIPLPGSPCQPPETTNQEVTDQELLETLSETLGALIVVLDPEGRIVRFNRACEELTGFPRAEVLGRPIWEVVIPPEDREEIRQVFQTIMLDHLPSRHENAWLTRRGERRWIAWQNTVLRNAAGQAAYGLATGIDRSSERAQERHLAESERRYRELLQQLPVAIWVEDFSRVREILAGEDFAGVEPGDPASTLAYLQEHPELLERCAGAISVIEVNRAAVEMFRASSSDDLIRNIPRTFTPESFQHFAHQLAAYRTGSVFWECEAPMVTLDGSPLFVAVDWRIPGHEEKRDRVLLTMVDITRRKQAERRLTSNQKLQAVGTLAGGIAHDFNNLLGAIQGFGELALAEIEPRSQAADDLRHQQVSIERAAGLVKQILAFSRHDTRGQKALDLSSLLEETLQMLRSVIPTRIEIRSDLDTSVPAWIHGDPGQIQQVVMNLCSNAAHAMEESGGLLEVRLRDGAELEKELGLDLEAPRGLLALQVRDQGRGIPPEIRDRVFEPFFTTKPSERGTGLGLAMVHGIVSSHRGSVTLRSSPEGTCFTVLLPRHPLPLPQSASPGRHRGGEVRRILVVDDEPDLVSVLTRMLRRLGHHVDGTLDPRDGLERATRSPANYDLVLTDLTMPGMTGVDLARALREAGYPGPVLLCTGYNEAPSFLEGEEEIFTRILHKPVSVHQLRDVLAELETAASSGQASPDPTPPTPGAPASGVPATRPPDSGAPDSAAPGEAEPE